MKIVKLTDILFKNKYGRDFLIINLFWGLIFTIIYIMCGFDGWIYSLSVLFIYVLSSVVVWQMGRKFPIKEKDKDMLLKFLVFAIGVVFCFVLLLYNPENAVAIHGSALTSFVSAVFCMIRIEGRTNIREILFGNCYKLSVNYWMRVIFYIITMCFIFCFIIFIYVYRFWPAVKSLYSLLILGM